MPNIVPNLQVRLPNLKATQALACQLAQCLAPKDTLLLQGDLGAGKTEFARQIIRALPLATGALAVDEEVPSPTYTLLQSYDRAVGTVWHYDLYRLSEPEELFELAWEEAQASGVCLIEWPQRLGCFKPGAFLDLDLALDPETDQRVASLSGSAEWHPRLALLAESISA